MDYEELEKEFLKAYHSGHPGTEVYKFLCLRRLNEIRSVHMAILLNYCIVVGDRHEDKIHPMMLGWFSAAWKEFRKEQENQSHA